MAVRIEEKIVAYDVVPEEEEGTESRNPADSDGRRQTGRAGSKPPPGSSTGGAVASEAVSDASSQGASSEESNVIQMQPLLKRPEALQGATYKIRTPLSEHALYVTINDIDVNGNRRPFEIFINSKNMENFAWIVALTRVISAVFRHAGDATFLVEELRSVFDPRGGYFKPGGKYMPSLVADIGECIEHHMTNIGMLQPPEVSEELHAKRLHAKEEGLLGGSHCPKCSQLSVVRLDGCDTCLECGYSKCG